MEINRFTQECAYSWGPNDSEETSNYSFSFEFVSVMETQKVISRRKIVAWKSGKFSQGLNSSFVSCLAIWDCQLNPGFCCVSRGREGSVAGNGPILRPATKQFPGPRGEQKSGSPENGGTAGIKIMREHSRSKTAGRRGPPRIRIKLQFHCREDKRTQRNNEFNQMRPGLFFFF